MMHAGQLHERTYPMHPAGCLHCITPQHPINAKLQNSSESPHTPPPIPLQIHFLIHHNKRINDSINNYGVCISILTLTLKIIKKGDVPGSGHIAFGVGG